MRRRAEPTRSTRPGRLEASALVLTLFLGRRHDVVGPGDGVRDHRDRSQPERRRVDGGCADRRRQVDSDFSTRDEARGDDPLHAALCGVLLHLGRGMHRDLLIAKLVLLCDQLSLLVLEACDVIGGLGDLGCDRQVEQDDDHERPDKYVRVAEHVQPQPFGRDRGGDLNEAARAASPPWRGVVVRRSAGRAEAPSGQYSGRCQDVNFILWCVVWLIGCLDGFGVCPIRPGALRLATLPMNREGMPGGRRG